MKVFFDTEFTGLHQGTKLISIGLIDEEGHTFYAETCDFMEGYRDIDDLVWAKENLIPKLRFYGKQGKGYNNSGSTNRHTTVFGEISVIRDSLESWLIGNDDPVEIWSDCLAYDWVLFNQLFGHAFKIPNNVYYIPFDICTMFKILNIDPDINREEFAGMLTSAEKHNSLWDAKVIKACYEKMAEMMDCTSSTY
ncbi:MAG: hypothetical protein HN597_03510 [Desulfobacula sp.]|jgi:hypothetical protein|uniref:3'-5' exoribonuclease domain-containing protein n=1 Tax=Desulfobacula sp. TaxID=2593537 RepID=UPI0039B9B939|nr:hypothetical protein [Desulfobacula sp.]